MQLNPGNGGLEGLVARSGDMFEGYASGRGMLLATSG